MTANQDIQDAALRHQVHVRRFASGAANRMLDLLEKADRDTVAKIREQLTTLVKAGVDPSDSRTLRRLNAVLEEIRRERERLLRAIADQVDIELVDFGQVEAEFEVKILDQSIPIAVDLPKLTPRQVKVIATEQPFAGRALGEWWDGLRAADQQRILDQIRIGVIQGQTIPQIIQRLAGTRRNRFRDGILAVTRRQAEAIVRTGVNGISNAVRRQMWAGFGDAAAGLVWTATLDGRTSQICRSRDGHIRPVSRDQPIPEGITLPRLKPPFAEPPAHPNCRSTLVGYVAGIGLIGDRPFVRDKRRRNRREADFKAEAKADIGAAEWSKLSEKERRARIRDKRNEWIERNIGQVPADTDYDTWLRRQPAGFQDDVMGKSRGALFRRGGLKQDQFVDFNGDTLTLDELRGKFPEAFERAGV